MIGKLFRKLFRRRVVMVTGMELTDWELQAALNMDDQHPVWRAIHQIFAEELENARKQVSAPEMADFPGALAHTAGGIEWLEHAQMRFVDIREEARRVKEKEEKIEKKSA